MIENIIAEICQDIAKTFGDPKKRVFIGYLVCATVIAIFWLKYAYKKYAKENQGSSFRKNLKATLFSRNIWWSTSAKADYKLILVNKILFSIISPALITQLAVATLLFETFHRWNIPRAGLFINISDTALALSFTLFLFLLDDFARFYLHRMMHLIPALWAFHEVHHSARTMTPLTVMRTHPMEGVLFSLRSSLVQGVTIALFLYLFGNRVDLVTILGANFITFVFNVTGSNLRHSHVAIHYWPWLEKIFISPAQHQIHHSVEPRHFDKNFGAMLAIWDRVFGSLHISEPEHTCQFGTSKRIKPEEQSLKALLIQPFINAIPKRFRTKKKAQQLKNQS